MNKLDAYYRASKYYIEEFKLHNSLKQDVEDMKSSDIEADELVSTRFVCTINEDWVLELEKGLPFVEKAIAEERQFIKVNGETIPIEKVKKVSKNSVEHLARHSNFITHVPKDGKDIIPDKLYITEKLTDYAVYENRFLYYMLDYLDKFISLRLSNIEKMHSRYLGSMKLKKSFEDKNRKYSFSFDFNEEVNNNPFSIVSDESKALIDRIKNCQQIVSAFLRGHLMQEVKKAPLIKLPITKTNVLKMNYNFKNSLALYEYIASYEGLGYEVNEVKKDFKPLPDVFMNDEFAAIRMAMFKTYEYGNEASEKLLNSFNQEEERRRIEAEAKLQERIERMRKLARESGKTMEEYMLLLEERNFQLLKNADELARCKKTIHELEGKIEGLNLDIAHLNDEIANLNTVIKNKDLEIAALKQKYIDDMAKLKQEHNEEINAIEEKHDLEINNLKASHEDEILEINHKHEEELAYIKKENEDNIAAATQALNNKIDDLLKELDDNKLSHQNEVASLRNEIIENKQEFEKRYNDNNQELTEKINKLEEENKDYLEKYNLFKCELDALRIKDGKITPTLELTSRERFIELEEEYRIFDKFFTEQWNLTKKQIRKEILKKRK